MFKKLKIGLVFIFSIILLELAGNTPIASVPVKYSPKDVGMDPAILNRIGSIVNAGIKARAFPGCQVFVMKDGKPIYDKCFGHYTYEGTQDVKPTTMYDLASLSKTTGTLLAIMKLYDEGKLKLSDKIATYLPFLQGTDKDSLTISELLLHESGLQASLSCYCLATTKDTTQIVRIGNSIYKQDMVSMNPTDTFNTQISDSFYIRNNFHEAAMTMIANSRLRNKTYIYSCVNFLLLKEVVETISGISMDVFLDSTFYRPMELKNTAYLPLRTHQKQDIAPTLKKDFLRNGILQGYVHDPDAAFLGGISGNAGLFASARDVATVHQMILNNGELNGKRYLSAETCRVFTTTTSASGRRGLGFDKPFPSNPAHNPCCISAPREVYGHTGYTGTCCWVDPVNGLVFVFLSNRTYPFDGVNKLARMGIRTKIQEVLYQSLKQK